MKRSGFQVLRSTLQLCDPRNSEVVVIAHLSILGKQGNLEQPFCCLAQEVRVQHSYFTDVTRPDLWRGLPKAFPDLECIHKHRKIRRDVLKSKGTRGEKKR